MKNTILTYFSNIKKRFKFKNYITYLVFVVIIAILIPMSLTGSVSMSSSFLLEQIGTSIICAVSLSLVVGFLGELSLGHAGFISIGAMFGATFLNNVYPEFYQATPLLAIIVTMLIGGIISAIFGFIIGLPALRLKGDYLAIVTLAFCQIVQTVFEQIDFFGGTIGIQNSARYDYSKFYPVIFIVCLVAIILINNFIRSKHGRAVTAIRDNEIAARAMGINVSFYKIFVFVFSSFIAGVAGVLIACTKNTVAANAFTYNYSIDILVMVVLGGMGSINGSIIAATLITFLNVKLSGVFSGNLATLKNIIYALILIVIVIYTNAPKLKPFREKYNLSALYNTVKDKIIQKLCKKTPADNPSKEKEFGADWSKIPTKIDMDALLSVEVTTPEQSADDSGLDTEEGEVK